MKYIEEFRDPKLARSLAAAIAEGGGGPRSALARFYVNRLLPEQ